jgi:hypothetical protein
MVGFVRAAVTCLEGDFFDRINKRTGSGHSMGFMCATFEISFYNSVILSGGEPAVYAKEKTHQSRSRRTYIAVKTDCTVRTTGF